MLTLVGYLCFAFAIIDFGVTFFGIDITGVRWSPLAAGLLGSVFLKLGAKPQTETSR